MPFRMHYGDDQPGRPKKSRDPVLVTAAILAAVAALIAFVTFSDSGGWIRALL